MPELIFMDLEWNTAFCRTANGARAPFSELIEVAAIKVDQATGAMLDSFHSYVHPTVCRKIEGRTYRLLPYSREELRDLLDSAPTFLDLGPAFLHWCGPEPVFVEWGSNDMDVLFSNFERHRLSLDPDWRCQYFDLQYMYQVLCQADMSCQPSLEKAVTDLRMDTGLDFHSAWNDTYYTVLVYQSLIDRFSDFQLFSRPPKRKGWPPLLEIELGTYDTRWGCKNHRAVHQPVCPLCGQPLTSGRWVRTTPTEQVMRGWCKEHHRIYVAVESERDGGSWTGTARFYKDAGPVAERYRRVCRKLQEKARRQREKAPA